jgi:hypothetical protein
MRYELTDHEWAAIRPMLPNKSRGVPRANDRRVLNGIFWVLRSGAPWRDLQFEFDVFDTKPIEFGAVCVGERHSFMPECSLRPVWRHRIAPAQPPC